MYLNICVKPMNTQKEIGTSDNISITQKSRVRETDEHSTLDLYFLTPNTSKSATMFFRLIRCIRNT